MAVTAAEDVGTRENVYKKSKNSLKIDKKALLVAQDIKIAKILSGNNKKLRDRALKRMKKWFQLRTQTMPLTEDDFMRIWKGLFYTMWMSDKPLVQEECAENIANLVHFPDVDNSLLFFKCALRTLHNEWFGIDQLRLGKFLMFVRRLLRQGLTVLKNNLWDVKLLKKYNSNLNDTILNLDNPAPGGLLMHFMEIYLEEVAKVSEGDLKPHLLLEMLKPFVKHLSGQKDNRFISSIKRYIFRHLMRQSDMGLEFEEKFRAWQNEGFPGESIDSMQKEQLDDEVEEEMDDEQNVPNENILDPRAGHVDVMLPQLKFHAKQVVELLKQNKFLDGTNTKSRKAITTLIEEFTEMTKGRYPLGVTKVDLPKKDGYSVKTKNAVNRLIKFENKIMKKNKRKSKHDESLQPSAKRKRKDVQMENIDDKSKKLIEKNKIKPKGTKIKVMKQDLTKKLKRKALIRKITKPVHPVQNGFEIDDFSDLESPSFEVSFRRNSGTWYVYNGEDSLTDSSFMNSSISQKNDSKNESQDSSHNVKKFQLDESIQNEAEKQFPKKESVDFSQDKPCVRINGNTQSPTEVKSSPKIENESTESSKSIKSKSPNKQSPLHKKLNKISPTVTSTPELGQNIFKQNEWEVPLKDGELEIFVPSNKFKNKIKNNVSVDETFKRKLKMIKGKSRVSLDGKLVKNPFAKTPESTKKVKIDLKLNKSQEIHEHVAKIKNSPGIPFDANRKPSKPLLKSSISGPINPFYSKKLK